MTGIDEKGMVDLRKEVVYLSLKTAGSPDLFTHSFGEIDFMKSIGFFLVLLLASGCATSPGMSSAQRQFCKEHPGAEILGQTANAATEHTGYWPHSTTRRYADYTFRYRGADGVEHEEVYHYKHLNQGWSVEKEEPR